MRRSALGPFLVAAVLLLAGSSSPAQSVVDSAPLTAIVHVPPHLSFAGEPIRIEVEVACRDAPEACAVRLGYRPVARGVLDDVGPFTEVTMAPDPAVPPVGTVTAYAQDIPPEVATTAGVDYYVLVTDSLGETRWPLGVGEESPVGLNEVHRFRRMDVLATPAIVHEPAVASPVGHPITVRFQSPCPATRACQATVRYRQTPIGGSQLSVGDISAWATTPVRTSAVSPAGTGAGAYAYEAEIPGHAVDSRGVDYVIRTTDGDSTNYWPGAPYQAHAGPADGPVAAWHVHALNPPAIVHAPVPVAETGKAVEVTWTVTCSTTDLARCDTAAFWRHAEPLPTPGNGAFTRLDAQRSVTLQREYEWILTATAVIPPHDAAQSREQYYLWATDGATNTYLPGTPYAGHVSATDGVNAGSQRPYEVVRAGSGGLP